MAIFRYRVSPQAKRSRKKTIGPANAVGVLVLGVSVVISLLRVEAAIATPRTELTVTPSSIDELRTFQDSVTDQTPFHLPDMEKKELVDRTVAGVWVGSRSSIQVESVGLTLRFSPKPRVAASDSEQDGPPSSRLSQEASVTAPLSSFDVKLNSTGNRLEIRHSAGEGEFIDGVSLPIEGGTHVHTAFIAGRQDSGLYVALPPIANREKAWGVLLCPRRVEEKRINRRVLPQLFSSHYDLTEAQVALAGNSEATLSTAGQEGRAQVLVTTTKNISAPLPDFDRAVSVIPQVDLKYSSFGKSPFFAVQGASAFAEGLQCLVEMQNKPGYVRRQRVLFTVAVNRLASSPLTAIEVNKSPVSTDDGECFVAVVRRKESVAYSREVNIFN